MFLGGYHLRAQNFLSWRYSDRYFSFYTGSGQTLYLGELNKTHQLRKIPSIAQVGMEARLWSKVSTRLEAGYYVLESGDHLAPAGSFEQQRNLSFYSGNFEASLHGVFYMRPYAGDYYRRWRVDPYLALGVGYSSYNPQAGFNGKVYELRSLQTEGVLYKKGTLVLPGAAGIKLKVNDFVNLTFELAFRYTFTDYLDDVSGDFVAAADQSVRSALINRKNEIRIVNPEAYRELVTGNPRGNPANNDHYLLLCYRIEFFIPNKKGPVLKKPSAY